MNLGKPRRRLTVADRPSVDLDAYFDTDPSAESDMRSERESAPTAGRDRDDAVTDAVSDGSIEH